MVTNAVTPAEMRWSARHQKPISANDVAPITSQAKRSVGRACAVAVVRAAAANSSISPWNRPCVSRISPAEKINTSSVTTATMGTINADRVSTPSAKSLPAMNRTDTSGRDRATTNASPAVRLAVTSEMAAAARSRRDNASALPTTAGSRTSVHSAASFRAVSVRNVWVRIWVMSGSSRQIRGHVGHV
ncbi:hypothetical protein [Nocardioides convexus]|uniref:hypothetical protein n=1 Tax=Nocardioides convexus TaxID=2712224 RepID=UPI0024187A14|nr:hypothetical protein [Nocardioides convexus]